MKPKQKKPEIVYRLIDRESGEHVGVYSRAYCDEFDFESENEARNSNFSGKYLDKDKYNVKKYKVTYTEIVDDELV